MMSLWPRRAARRVPKALTPLSGDQGRLFPCRRARLTSDSQGAVVVVVVMVVIVVVVVVGEKKTAANRTFKDAWLCIGGLGRLVGTCFSMRAFK